MPGPESGPRAARGDGTTTPADDGADREDAGRTVIVTGAGSGIGGGCARRFLAAGWNVVFGVYDDDNRRSAERDIAAAAGDAAARAAVVQGDISADADCRALARTAVERFGGCDALINGAGTTRIVPQPDLDALDADDFQRLYAVNTIGPFQMIRACAAALKASGDGAVVNMSSYGGLNGGGSSIAYAASKGALNTLTLSLARLLAPEVRVNAVCPTLVEGGFVQRLDPDGFVRRRRQEIAAAPLRRIGTPAEVAGVVYWLVTAAPMITGEIVRLDQGLHLHA